MDDNDRRRYNSEENDYYTNNSRRTPVVPPRGYNPSQDAPRRDYGYQSGVNKGYPQREGYPERADRNPQSSPQNARPSYERAMPSATQGAYGQYGGQRSPYAPSQPQPYVRPQQPSYSQSVQQGAYQRPPYGAQSSQPYQQYTQTPYTQQGFQGGYPPQGAPDQTYAPMDERDFAYGNVQAQPVEKKKRGFFGFGKSKKEEVDPSQMGNVVITEPRSFDDVRVIIDGLRRRQAIIIDFSKISDKDSQRILDLLSGAIYALGGAQQRINDHMFLFTPEGVMIQGPASLRNKYK